MTPSELKARYYELQPNGHFFDRDSMKFFGDTMKNYAVSIFYIGDEKWYELRRKRPVKHNRIASQYFRHSDMRTTTIDPETP